MPEPLVVQPQGDPVPPRPLAGYTLVTLKRAVTVEGQWYRPGPLHTVDAATLAALGDAVATQKAAG